jgi:hypothetical protein
MVFPVMFGKVGISVSLNVISVVLDLRKRSNRIVLECVGAIDPVLAWSRPLYHNLRLKGR